MEAQPIKQKTYNRIYVAMKQLQDDNPLKYKLEMQLKRLKHEIEGKTLIECVCCPVFGCTFCENITTCDLASDTEKQLVLTIHKQMPYKTWQEIPRNNLEYYDFVLNLRKMEENKWNQQSNSKMATA